MIRLPDTPRQVLAGGLSGAAFLGLYLGLSLVWWLALGLSLAVYPALLLVIARRRPLEEIVLGGRVSAADLAAAVEALDVAASRLEAAAAEAPEADRGAITDIAAQVRAVRRAIADDPADVRATRGFVSVYLPKIVQSVEAYARLAGQAGGASRDRVAALGAQIRGFAPAIARIHAAALENDLRALEVEVSVLSGKFGPG